MGGGGGGGRENERNKNKKEKEHKIGKNGLMAVYISWVCTKVGSQHCMTFP